MIHGYGNRHGHGHGNRHENRHDHEDRNDYENDHENENDNENEDRHGHGHGHDRDRFKKFKETCHVSINEEIEITTPVIIHAHVNTHDVDLECGGHEIIREHSCRRRSKRFKVRQKIYACIPLEFVAEVDIGEGHVDFDPNLL
ncbi:MAG: hypothetical protein FWC69_01365 [Defluviitaleaceae bacterium]|nr:hypothetical protein [Defluviitaleaceae bacterium]